ncbi:MAG: NADH-quinone oxidoreductase subunit J [Planctomycetota bacterium]
MNKNLIGAIGAGLIALAAVAFVVVKALSDAAFVDEAIFLAASTLGIALSVVAVTRKNPVYAILNLLGVFVMMAALFFVLAADMLAVLQILVYAGAILMLFLFVIMLFNLGGSDPAAEASVVAGTELGRKTADEAEKTGEGGFWLNTPKLRAMVFSMALAALLIMPIVFLVHGDPWESFTPRHLPTRPMFSGVEDGNGLREFRVWIVVEDTATDAPAPVAAGGSTLISSGEKDAEGTTVGYRITWSGPMSDEQRDALIETRKGDAVFATAVKQLQGMARWQQLELGGMTDREITASRDRYKHSPMAVKRDGFGSIPRVGWDLFDAYLIPFEFVSLILLAGMVGAVVLALRKRAPGEGGPLVPTKPVGDGDVSLFERHLGATVGQGLVHRPELHDVSAPVEHKPAPDDDAIYDTDGDDD